MDEHTALAADLVRGYAAIDEILQEQYAHEGWATPNVVAERLEAEVARRLAERDGDALHVAVDGLGRGRDLDPWDVLAFRAPVEVRSHGCVLSDEPIFSAEIEAVRAELLTHGIVVLAEEHGAITISAYNEELAVATVRALLPDIQIDCAGPTPRRIFPARCVSWRLKADDEIRAWVRVGEEEHIDDVVAAEDARRVVVLAFVCTPSAAPRGPVHAEPARVHLAAPLGTRTVVDGFSGDPLSRE